MVSTVGSTPGTGFLQVLKTRKPTEHESTEQRPDAKQAPTNVRTQALTRRPVDDHLLARMAAILQTEGPPSLAQPTFTPDGRSLSSGRMPPAEYIQPVMLQGVTRLGNAPNLVSDRAGSTFRHVHANQVSERVKSPWYMAFHDPTQEIALRANVNDTNRVASQIILKGPYSFWTRDLTSGRDGVRLETVKCNLGKVRYSKESTREGWTITEPTYAVDQCGKEQFHRCAVRIVTSADGRDRLYKYDKGRLLGVEDKPIELLT